MQYAVKFEILIGKFLTFVMLVLKTLIVGTR